MKCREGCEGTKSSAEFVCMQCWHRVPKMLRLAVLYAATVERQAVVKREILEVLAADDKRRAE